MIRHNALLPVSIALTAPALGQFINLDVAADAGGPAATYGAAALVAGTWNTVIGSAPHAGLLDRLGNPTGVSVTVFDAGNGSDMHFDSPFTGGDDEALLDDWRSIFGLAAFNEVDVCVSGLAPGFHEVTTYAWAPGDPAARMHVSISGAGVGRESGGPWPGALVEGVTHVRQVAEVRVDPPFDVLMVRVMALSDALGAFDGMQIAPLAGDPAQTAFCTPQAPNSTGVAGELTVIGDEAVARDLLVVDVRSLPPGRFGYLLASTTQGFFPTPPGSQGNLCLDGSIARFVNQVISSGPAGVVRLELDLTAFPLTPPVPVLPGDTWHFQFWHRDVNPAPTANFSTAQSFSFS